MKKTFWIYGEQKALAKMVGTYPSYISDLIRRKKEASGPMAKRLDECSAVVLGPKRRIPLEAWLFTKTTSHPAFIDETKKR